jgi:hypothetical protein
MISDKFFGVISSGVFQGFFCLGTVRRGKRYRHIPQQSASFRSLDRAAFELTPERLIVHQE